MSEDSPDKPAAPSSEPENRARRRLLAMAIYVPPAVLGTIAVTLQGCQTASCAPAQCQPAQCGPADCDPGGCPPVVCNPNLNPCNPKA